MNWPPDLFEKLNNDIGSRISRFNFWRNRDIKVNQNKAANLAKGLANVNAALGFVLERSLESHLQQTINGQKSGVDQKGYIKKRIDLELAIDVNKKASGMTQLKPSISVTKQKCSSS